MSIYFDTSALAKLVVTEQQTSALRAWLGRRPSEPKVTASIGVVELQRFAARVSPQAMTAAAQLIARIDHLDLGALALLRAAQVRPPEVRTLDALHIAAASQLNDLTAIVTYERRMIDACVGYDLPVVSPELE